VSSYDYFNPVHDLNSLAGSITSTGSTQDDKNAILRAQRNQGQFQGLASAFQPQITAANTNLAANNNAQNANIAALAAYANGTAPSAAQLQLQQQSANNQAANYGTAAALQGRNPGQALSQAMRANVATQGATNSQGAQLRAQEQQQGQSALASALGQQANVQSGLRQQGLGYLSNLYGAQNQALGSQVSAAGNETDANVQNAQMLNSTKGGIVGGVTQAGSALLSDEREKHDIKPATGGAFDKLAEALKGYGYEYDAGAPGAEPGPRTGVMAQDALKGGPAGRAMVSEGGDGALRMDRDNMLGAALAMSAEAIRRTKDGGARGGRGGLVKALRKAA